MAEQVDRKADATRRQILESAAVQFAVKPYSLVNLDDILADAAVTKGAMYHHFRSKYALASEIVDQWVDRSGRAIAEVVARRHSGMETLVDITFLVALDDIGNATARAGLNLLESVGRTDGLHRRAVDTWVAALSAITRQAVDEGDLTSEATPEDTARTLVSIYLGTRQTNSVDESASYLEGLRRAWTLVLPGLVDAERVEYLSRFVSRRAALAVKKATPLRADTL